ncbi:MAG: iron chelate uptake ABC transporter family permease subunit [candidate division Zixibacteria bacterium]|nr:iron chelate uptake ABC transporter family permease subunit [candidate division Zixibacteria bacterium]
MTEILTLLKDLFTDYTLRTVAMGSATLGIVSGALGCFAVLRKQSLLGDAISHAALPGIALAFLFTGSKSPLIIVIGAAIIGWIGTMFIMSIVKHTRIKSDSALGLVLSSFFGFGLVLLTFIQRMPTANQAGLDTFLFGQASALLERDIVVMGVLGLVVLAIMSLFWKEFKLISFDPDFAASNGFPIQKLDILITSLIVIAIVIGLQTVGVVLMSAMVVAPAAAARQWTDRLSLMIIIAAFFGALAGVSGSMISSLTSRLPTGPTIVLCISFLVGVSMLFAPNRGLIWNWLRRQRNRRKLQLEAVLSNLYELAKQHGSIDRAHSKAVLEAMSPDRAESVDSTLDELQKRRWARVTTNNQWAITQKGWDEVERFLKESSKK